MTTSQATRTRTTEPSGSLATLEEIRAEVARLGVTIPVEWDRAKKRAGLVTWHRVTGELLGMSFSRLVWPFMTPQERRNTITHEVAHALAGPHAKHGEKWRALHRSLGGDGERCGDVEVPESVLKSKYIGTCPAGHEIGRSRRTSAMDRESSCKRCAPYFSKAHLVTWRTVR
jgi:hypothetical protein